MATKKKPGKVTGTRTKPGVGGFIRSTDSRIAPTVYDERRDTKPPTHNLEGDLNPWDGWAEMWENTSIGQRIRFARTEEGMTQQEFADLLNVSQSAVGSWEKDQTMPKKEAMQELATHLQISEFWLWFGDLPDDEALDRGVDPTSLIKGQKVESLQMGAPTKEQFQIRNEIIETQTRELEELRNRLQSLIESEDQKLHSVNKTTDAAKELVEGTFRKLKRWEEPGYGEYMTAEDLQESGGQFLGAVEGKYGPIAMQQAEQLQENINLIDGGIRIDDPKPTSNVTVAPDGVSASGVVGNVHTFVKDIPILGTAAAAGPEGPAFQFDRSGTDIVDYANRAIGVSHVKDLYALEVVGDSMSPKHEDGHILIVSYRRRPVIGDTVIVQVYLDPDEPEKSEIRAYVKVLEKRNDLSVVLKQFHPEVSTITLPTSHIKYLDRVVPEQELLGFK